jgi:hypothetical protein
LPSAEIVTLPALVSGSIEISATRSLAADSSALNSSSHGSPMRCTVSRASTICCGVTFGAGLPAGLASRVSPARSACLAEWYDNPASTTTAQAMASSTPPVQGDAPRDWRQSSSSFCIIPTPTRARGS